MTWWNVVSGVAVVLVAVGVRAQACSPYESGYLTEGDWDGDGLADDVDLCPTVYSSVNDDVDGDGVGDPCDRCPLVADAANADQDGDGVGDVCDPDPDGDLVLDGAGAGEDTAPQGADTADTASSAEQTDTGDPGTESGDSSPGGTDTAGPGDADTQDTASAHDTGSTDAVGYGTDSLYFDNCPGVYNPSQSDQDGDGAGDACDGDLDGDGAANAEDPCPADPDRQAADGLEQTAACLGDRDGDGVLDFAWSDGQAVTADNCPDIANPDQRDWDGDGRGDPCDVDADGDGVADGDDNCTLDDVAQRLEEAGGDWSERDAAEIAAMVVNPDQGDLDRDGVGDSCDKVFDADSGTWKDDVCQVILGDSANCLHVTSDVLEVYSPKVVALRTDDDPVRLRLFANVDGAHLAYEWRILDGDSRGVVLHNARGTVSCSSLYEYHYDVTTRGQEGEAGFEIIDHSATVEAKLAGTYVLGVTVWRLDEDGRKTGDADDMAQASVVVNVSGDDEYVPDGCGCQVVGAAPSRWWLALWVGALVWFAARRRRRREG